VQENSKTFHMSSLHSQKKEKEKEKEKEKLNSHPSRQRNKYLFSNYTLLTYLESSNRQHRKEKPADRSPPKQGKKAGKPSSKWKDRNKSTSAPNGSHKQTI
jgi:hypothetical protein